MEVNFEDMEGVRSSTKDSSGSWLTIVVPEDDGVKISFVILQYPLLGLFPRKEPHM
jgi:hypothetical protein